MIELHLQIPKTRIYFCFCSIPTLLEWIQEKENSSDSSGSERWSAVYKHFQSKSSSANGTTITVPEGVLIWIRDTVEEPLVTLVHEDRHVADIIRQRFRIDDTEYYAYLEDFLFREFSKVLIK